jgi:hypothetical protein
MLQCALVSVTITLQPALTMDCEEPSSAGHSVLAEYGSAQTIVRSSPIEKALDDLRARFPNRIVVGFEEVFDQHPATEPRLDLGPKDSSLEEVLNRIRGIDSKYRIELLPRGLVHVHPALQTADPVGLLDIRLREFSMPQDSCLEQAIGNIDERDYAPELTRFLAQRKEVWCRSRRRQILGVVGDVPGDCFASAAPGPAYRDITVREALDLMARRSLQVSRGEVTSNSPVHAPYKPISWRFRFRHDADSDTGLGGVPVFQTFK